MGNSGPAGTAMKWVISACNVRNREMLPASDVAGKVIYDGNAGSDAQDVTKQVTTRTIDFQM